jgi:hypothetical protein
MNLRQTIIAFAALFVGASEAFSSSVQAQTIEPITPFPSCCNQFAAEVLAKAHCPSDTVVWANLNAKIYHFSGSKNYGSSKEGTYMCEKDALGQGVRAAKNERHP